MRGTLSVVNILNHQQFKTFEFSTEVGDSLNKPMEGFALLKNLKKSLSLTNSGYKELFSGSLQIRVRCNGFHCTFVSVCSSLLRGAFLTF